MPGVRSVLYPHHDSHPQVEIGRRQMSAGSTLVAFVIDDDGDSAKASTFQFLDALQVIDICNNLGDSKSLITHPATTTHRRVPAEQRAELGISDSLVRLSVGLEDTNDLLNDLETALKTLR
jgi:O-succinylhomoserine sulfhydrylase